MTFTDEQVTELKGLRRRMPLGMKGQPLEAWIIEMVSRAFDFQMDDEQVYGDDMEDQE